MIDGRPDCAALGAAAGPQGPAAGPAGVPAAQVLVQSRGHLVVDLSRDTLVDLPGDPVVDLRADAFHQALGQRLLVARAEMLLGCHRCGDLVPAIRVHGPSVVLPVLASLPTV